MKNIKPNRNTFLSKKFYLVWGLIFQITLGPLALQYSFANPTGTVLANPTIESKTESTTHPLIHIDQFHEVYEPLKSSDGKSEDVLKKKYSLSEINVGNPSVVVNNVSEIRPIYDARARRLSFQRYAYDAKLKRHRLTDAHTFENISITSNIAMNPNEVFFADSAGVRGLLTDHLTRYFGSTALVTPVVLPNHPLGHQIRGIDLKTPELKPDPKMAHSEDGTLRLTFSSGETQIVPGMETTRNLASGILISLAILQTTNPDLNDIEAVQEILRGNSADLARLMETYRTALDGPRNDAVAHAYKAIAQRVKPSEFAGILKRDEGGKNQVDHLAEASKHLYPLETWEQYHKTIAEEHARETAAGLEHRQWRQILVDAAKGYDRVTVELAARAQQSTEKRYIDRIKAAFKQHATTKRVVAAATFIGLGVLNWQSNGELAYAVTWGLTGAYNFSLSVPLLKNITGMMGQSVEFIAQADAWLVARLAMGTMIVLAFNPISYWLAQKYAKFRKFDADKYTAFFTYGTQGYGMLNTPPQKPILDLAGQQGLYEAMVDSKVDPLRFPRVFTFPFATRDEETRLENLAKLNEQLSADAVVKSRAALLAAAIVSETSGASVDIASLLLAGEGERIESFRTLSENAIMNSRWTTLTSDIYRGLISIGDTGSNIGPAELGTYLEYYGRVADRFKTQSDSSLRGQLSLLWRRARNMMSNQVLPFILFGKQFYDVARRYAGVQVVHKNTVEVARHGYDEDYKVSSLIYAGIDPVKFSDVAVLGNGMPEILANQGSQVFIYGVQGAIDPPDAAGRLSNPYKPLSTDLYSEQGQRQETFGKSLKILVDTALDPDSPSYAGQHKSVMRKLAEGFQVRFFADYSTRVFGTLLTLYMTTQHQPLAETIYETALLSIYFLIAKVSVQFNGGSLIPGYAVIWPYIQMAITQLQAHADRNAAQLQITDYYLTTGLRMEDIEMMRLGVDSMKRMYLNGGRTLPPHLHVDTSQYTSEMAEELHRDRLREAPIATKINQPIAIWLNRIGALVSTALFVPVSTAVYQVAQNPNGDPTSLLINTAGWFAVTMATMTGIQLVTPKVLRGIKKLRSTNQCVGRLGG